MLKSLASGGLLVALALGCGPGAEEPPSAESATAPMEALEEVDVAAVPAADSERLPAILAGAHRSAENRARDVYRHPIETLRFLGVEPDMTVVEVSPGGGWYTEVLAPYVRAEGLLYAAGADPDSPSEYAQRSVKRFAEKLAAYPEVYDRTVVTALARGKAIAPPGSADAVLTFRNVHNWLAAGSAEGVFQAMFVALKPGGILGVVEHRGDLAVEQDPKAPSGYVRQDFVIELAESVGFEFVEAAEINANPNDTRDYEKGVWTLPPSYRLKEVDREKYAAIGESDRMTLKFSKPEVES
ncbi:MAG: methyltransferase [Myxococcota bacterium]